MELVRPDPVGPHAGGVDHVSRADVELTAILGVKQLDDRLAALGREQLGHLQPVGADRAEPLGLAQHGQDEPGVVGLAVVEQVPAARPAILQGR